MSPGLPGPAPMRKTVPLTVLRLNAFDGSLRTPRVFENLAGALVDQPRRDACTEVGGRRPGPTFRRPTRAAAIQRDHGRHELQRVSVDQRRQRADRCLASAAERL